MRHFFSCDTRRNPVSDAATTLTESEATTILLFRLLPELLGAHLRPIWVDGMSERWLGVQVSVEGVIVVDAEVPDEGPITIVFDESFKLAKGDRAKAFCTMYSRLYDYAREKGIKRALIKESAVSKGGMGKAHLAAAELRGVAIAALGSACNVDLISKASISRNFGDRNVDQYVKDESFWNENTDGKMRSGSREAALLILASR